MKVWTPTAGYWWQTGGVQGFLHSDQVIWVRVSMPYVEGMSSFLLRRREASVRNRLWRTVRDLQDLRLFVCGHEAQCKGPTGDDQNALGKERRRDKLSASKSKSVIPVVEWDCQVLLDEWPLAHKPPDLQAALWSHYSEIYWKAGIKNEWGGAASY